MVYDDMNDVMSRVLADMESIFNDIQVDGTSLSAGKEIMRGKDVNKEQRYAMISIRALVLWTAREKSVHIATVLSMLGDHLGVSGMDALAEEDYAAAREFLVNFTPKMN